MFEYKCRTYKKWLVRISSQRLIKPVLIVWLTDVSDHNNDKMILTKSNRVVGATQHKSLFRYLSENKRRLPDSMNTITWLNEVKDSNFISATDYNITLIEESLRRRMFNEVSVYEAINFTNLFNDLAEQLSDDAFSRLSDKKEIRELWEFGYNEIFWKEYGSREELSALRISPFSTNYELLDSGMNQMIDAFINQIEILDA